MIAYFRETSGKLGSFGFDHSSFADVIKEVKRVTGAHRVLISASCGKPNGPAASDYGPHFGVKATPVMNIGGGSGD